MNKLGKGKIIAIVAVVVVLVGGFFGYKSYKNAPDHNPNNPLNGVNIEFAKYDGKTGLRSDDIDNKILQNIIVIMLEHKDPDSELIHEIKNSDDIVAYHFIGAGEQDMHEYLLGDGEYGGSDYKFTEEETRMLSELRRTLYNQNNTNDNSYDDDLITTNPSINNIKVGDTVEVKVKLPQEFADKYGISLTPKKVKVEKIIKHED